MSKEATVEYFDPDLARALFGPSEKHLTLIEEALEVEINTRGLRCHIKGDPIDTETTVRVLNGLYELLEEGLPVYDLDVASAIKAVQADTGVDLRILFSEKVFVSSDKGVITPKSVGQKQYIELIRKKDITFGIGPAGTGKTYLAMAMAVSSLLKKEFNRIILTRPAVEAGERLGFLPGDMMEKINPYLRPLYDALSDMLDIEKTRRLIDKGVIEVAPLAFMRGRTLNHSFVILDEAQNTTPEQMKMFLTRIGFGTRVVITGDITQIDLPEGRASGLVEAQNLLDGIGGVAFYNFNDKDVVRHPVVQEIVKAYEKGKRRE